LRADVGQYAGTGTPVMTLIAVHDLWVTAEFTENNLGHIREGTEVAIVFDVLPGKVFSGRVRSVGLGVSSGSPPTKPGTLPTIQNDRDFLRQSQRFAVIVDFDLAQGPELARQLRIGGQASVMAYTKGHGLLNFLGSLFIRLASWLSYAY
ncbi:MAG: efflux RND transporter periplasmic adaptor subunit, partial [Pseudomonadales bacterium]